MPSAEQELTQKVENQALGVIDPMETTINISEEAPEIARRESTGNKLLDVYRKIIQMTIQKFGSDLEALRLSLQESANVVRYTSHGRLTAQEFIEIANQEIQKVYES